MDHQSSYMVRKMIWKETSLIQRLRKPEMAETKKDQDDQKQAHERMTFNKIFGLPGRKYCLTVRFQTGCVLNRLSNIVLQP